MLLAHSHAQNARSWSSRASTSTSRWTAGRCAPSSPRRATAARTPASSSTPTSSSSPSRRCAGRCGSPATATSSRCPRSTTGSSRPGPCSSSTTRARCAARATPTRPRWPTSTPTSTPRSPGWASTRAARSAPPATAPAATSRSAPPSARRSARPRCWYATGLHDGKLGKDPDAGSLARAGEIEGELLAIWGTSDPHTPLAGRDAIKAGSTPLGVRLTWREYEAEHAFGRDVGDRYDPEVTDEAFAETIALFRRAL